MTKLTRYAQSLSRHIPCSYEKRRIAQRDVQTAKGIEKSMKDELKSKIIEGVKKRQDAKERRELNRVKSGQYQIIKDSTKIRKYDKKARAKVMKMSPELIEAMLQKKRPGMNI
jgi:hypothetical protein